MNKIFLPKFKYCEQWYKLDISNDNTIIINDTVEEAFILITNIKAYKKQFEETNNIKAIENIEEFDGKNTHTDKIYSNLFENVDDNTKEMIKESNNQSNKKFPLIILSSTTGISQWNIDSPNQESMNDKKLKNYNIIKELIEEWKQNKQNKAILYMKHENNLIKWITMGIIHKFPFDIIPIKNKKIPNIS